MILKLQNSFKYYFIQLTIFYIIYSIFTFLKYINTRVYYSNMDKFSQVYNSTQFSQIYLITRIDNIRQYLFNQSIIIYNVDKDQMINHFIICFLTLSKQLEDTIKQTSKTESFLKNEYKNSFKHYMYENFKEIIAKDERYIEGYIKYCKKSDNGFKGVSIDIFELLRFLYMKYFMDDERDAKNNISKLVNDQTWYEINNLFFYIVRPWYKTINNLMYESFYNFVQEKLIQSIIVFSFVIVLISIYY